MIASSRIHSGGTLGGIGKAWGYRVLTEAAVRAAKPKEKPYKLFDERGLYMLVSSHGRPALAAQVSAGRR
jgi:hypothetical protein